HAGDEVGINEVLLTGRSDYLGDVGGAECRRRRGPRGRNRLWGRVFLEADNVGRGNVHVAGTVRLQVKASGFIHDLTALMADRETVFKDGEIGSGGGNTHRQGSKSHRDLSPKIHSLHAHASTQDLVNGSGHAALIVGQSHC